MVRENLLRSTALFCCDSRKHRVRQSSFGKFVCKHDRSLRTPSNYFRMFRELVFLASPGQWRIKDVVSIEITGAGDFILKSDTCASVIVDLYHLHSGLFLIRIETSLLLRVVDDFCLNDGC